MKNVIFDILNKVSINDTIEDVQFEYTANLIVDAVSKTNDDTRDIAIKIVDKLVAEGLLKDCIDTDDETEFEVQDVIHNVLNEVLKVK
jgi:hypothetical protein